MFRIQPFSGRRTALDTACTVCVVVAVNAASLAAHEAVTDPRLTISVRTYADLDRLHADLETARARVERVFRPTGVDIEWLECHDPRAASHCSSPPAKAELIVRITAGKAADLGALVPLGVSLVDRNSRGGCYATV